MNRKHLFYHHNLKSNGLKFARDLIVWLPPSYFTAKRKRYPVLYMHDGQNIIDPKTSFLGVPWALDKVATRLIRKNRIREFIAAGIYNTPDRDSEYSGSVKGIQYASFIANDVKPLIDSTYRTNPEPEQTANMGASMGGLIAFLISWRHPHLFSMAGCISSAFLWKRNSIIKEVKNHHGPAKKIRVYIDCGSKGIDSDLAPANKKMYETLKNKGYRENSELKYYFDKNGDHNERDWSRRLWRPLTFFFGK